MKLIFSHLTIKFYEKIKTNPRPVLYPCADGQDIKCYFISRDVVTKDPLQIQVYIINPDSFSQESFDFLRLLEEQLA